ncbi:aldo-keto oxidoreductase, partial [Thalassiosira pseudonana CCMP1335]
SDPSLLQPPVLMPWVGYGTYRLGQRHARTATFQALNVGYRQIDTAFIYGGQTTEIEVGKAIQDALEHNIISSREELFITTKQWREYHGYEKSMECLNLSLDRLGVDYVDCWMMHWPGPSLRAETWRAMEDAYRQGKARSIAVSNFTIQHLELLKKSAKLWPPAVNQVECHPYYPQNELLEYCKREGIVVQAYASLGVLGGKLIESEPVLAASKHLSNSQRTVSAAQVLLRWALQRNCAIVPKTSSPARMKENANVFGFVLTDEEMIDISKLA